MAFFPYTNVVGRLGELFRRIREEATPEKATYKWLESLGFRQTNDRSMTRVLRFLGFTDEDGTPTQLWQTYRGPAPAKVLALAVRNAYKEVFSVYSDAYSRSNAEIEAVLAAKDSSAARGVIWNKARTFITLCGMADFSPTSDSSAWVTRSPMGQSNPQESGPPGPSVNLCINLHLALPNDADEEFYRRLFEAVRTHLLGLSGRCDAS